MKGDLIQLAPQFDVIVHGCNCFHTWGAGIALQMRRAYPMAYLADKTTRLGDREKLGTISYVLGKPIVVNAYTQFSFGQGLQVQYDAISSCFRIIRDTFHGLSIAYPKIGAGLAGGDWAIIKSIIDFILINENHTLIEYVRSPS